jgi:hypothetical protein
VPANMNKADGASTLKHRRGQVRRNLTDTRLCDRRDERAGFLDWAPTSRTSDNLGMLMSMHFLLFFGYTTLQYASTEEGLQYYIAKDDREPWKCTHIVQYNKSSGFGLGRAISSGPCRVVHESAAGSICGIHASIPSH